MTLREAVTKLAHTKSGFRKHLVPLLQKDAEEKWIQKGIKRPGALHKHFGIPEGEDIPTDKIKGELAKLRKKKEKSKEEERLTKQLNMALTLRSKEVPPPKGKK